MITTRTEPVMSTDDQHAVVERLAEAIDARLAEVPERLHIDDLLVATREKLGAEVAELDAAARTIVKSYSAITRAQGYTQPIADRVRGELGRLVRVADELFVDFDAAEELAAAEAEVDRIEADQQAAMVALQAAVESADVNEVMRLRPEVEITLPHRRDAARVKVLELQVARTEQGAGRSMRRQARAAADLRSAEKAHEKAESAWRQAETRLGAAQRGARSADDIADGITTSARRLREERDRVTAEAARSTQERTRRFAGISDSVVVGV